MELNNEKRREQSLLLEALLEAQKESGQNYITPEALKELGERFGLTENQVKDAATFYKHLSLEPRGKHVLQICKSPCCWLQGGREIAETIKTFLGIEEGMTTADGLFTLEYCGCIGACDQSPAMMLDDIIIGNLTADKVKELLLACREETL